MKNQDQDTANVLNNLQDPTDNAESNIKRVGGLLLGLTLVTALTLPMVAMSGYHGPVKQKFYTSVSDVLNDPIDDWAVMLEGRITLHEGGDFYRFTDPTGEIRIELEMDDMPIRPFDDSTVVRIMGEIEDNPMRTPMVEVDRVEIVGPL